MLDVLHVAPWGLERRVPPTFEAIPAHAQRSNLLVDLIDDWYETLTFDFAVTNATTETHSLRRLAGPYRIVELVLAQTGTDARNIRIYVSVDDTDADPSTTLQNAPALPRTNTTDVTTSTPSLPNTTSQNHIFPGQLVRAGTSRLSIVGHNISAAVVSIWGTIVICHMRPADPTDTRDY